MELFARENVSVLAKIQITAKNKVKLSLRRRQNKNKKSYRRAIGLNVYEENILVTDGEDKVQTSTKYGSKTSRWDSTIKATYQEIYI
jgi:hypothetical protein